MDRTAKAARASGATYYFTGLPCKMGHVSKRLAINNTCVECHNARRSANRDWRKPAAKRYSQSVKGRATINTGQRRRRQEADNKAYRASERRARQAAHLQRTPKWADLNEIRKLYDVSHWITKVTGVEHHVDHILPLQGKLVSGLHVTGNLRVIPGSENLAKNSKFMP